MTLLLAPRNDEPIVRDCVRRNGGVVGGFEAPELAGEARGERRGGSESRRGFAVVPQTLNPNTHAHDPQGIGQYLKTYSG